MIMKVYMIQDKFKTLLPYRPRALEAYVHPKISNLAEISIFNFGRDGHAGASYRHT